MVIRAQIHQIVIGKKYGYDVGKYVMLTIKDS